MGDIELNEIGLFVHNGARRSIEAFVRESQVGLYPMYLHGMALPEHRGGPSLVALLTLADGGVIDASARRLRKKAKVNGVLEADVDGLTGQELGRYRRVFFEEYGGFAGAGCLAVSPTAVAESMLRDAALGIRLAGDVGPHPGGPPKDFWTDWTDVVHYSQKAVGCTVEGFAPSADLVDRLDVPDDLKRRMQIAPSSDLHWLHELGNRLVAEVHAQIPPLVVEAWAVRLVSPRASVALLRSVAELVAHHLTGASESRFNDTLHRLEKQWALKPPDNSPAGRRETAWRAGVLSCFHTVRDLGNRIHADSVVDSTDLDLAHNSNRRLLESVLRVGPLDAVTSS